jgi:formylmethanofuran dehydrogenase subunit E
MTVDMLKEVERLLVNGDAECSRCGSPIKMAESRHEGHGRFLCKSCRDAKVKAGTLSN